MVALLVSIRKWLLLILITVILIRSSILVTSSVVVSDLSSALTLLVVIVVASRVLIVVALIVPLILILPIFVLVSSSLLILPLVFVYTFIEACISIIATMIVVVMLAGTSRLLLHLIVHVVLPYLVLVSFGRVVQIIALSARAVRIGYAVVNSVVVGSVSSPLTLLVISLVIVSLIILPFTPIIDISILPILVAHHRLVKAALHGRLLLRRSILLVASTVTLSSTHMLIPIVASTTIISRVLAIASLALTLMHVMIGAYVRTAMGASMIVASVPTAGVLLHRLVHHLLLLLVLVIPVLFGVIAFTALIRIIP